MDRDLLVITGAGGIGQAIARRQGPDAMSCWPTSTRTRSPAPPRPLKASASASAPSPSTSPRANRSRPSPRRRRSWETSPQVAHTAGVSPVQAPPSAVLAVDLLGTALVLEELGRVMAAGGAGVVISSMAGHMFPPFAPEQEHALAHTPTDELLDLPFLNADSMGRPPTATPSGPTTCACSRPA